MNTPAPSSWGRPVVAVFARACVLLAFGTAVATAAPLKVDINNTGRPLTEGLDPDFTPWTTNTTVFPTSATFSGVTVAFARVGSVGTGLQTGYWKEGIQNAAYNVRLTGDGLKVADGEAGAQIEMRITGLSAGAHTLLLHLSSWDSGTSIAPLDILVNGTQVVNNLAVSVRPTNNNHATSAYLTLTAVSGQAVVVLIKADTGGSQTSKNVHLDGFEIDTPNAKAQANSPVPANADEHVNADSGSVTLQWTTAVSGAASHNVYFGTSQSAVTNATAGSAEYKGNRTTNTYPASGINAHLTYYWRIDEVASGGAITKGDTWMFRPRRLAFPGAEGYGRFARGGRGGSVVKVTNLNDSGAGSLRAAIEGASGPCTIVFDVGGLITLQSDIVIDGTRPYITLAGQTAPGKGITVKRQQLTMSGSRDVIFRYVRLLVGKESGETQNATGMAGADHCIMDHVSAGWGIDEGLSTRGGKNLTFQRNNLSEALNVAGHSNYPAGTAHGYAASIGGDVGSFHHNLLAHNEGRNWSMAGGLDGAGYFAGKLDIFNNVVYNWGGRTTDGGAHQVNFVSNYYKRGPANGITTALNPTWDNFPGTQQYYMAGNVMPGYWDESNQAAGRTAAGSNGGSVPTSYSPWVSSAFFPSHATIHTARNACKQVLSDVGCNLPQIDSRDTRIIGETIAGNYTYTGSVSGKRGLPDTTNDVGGWESYPTTTRPAGFDSDNDGMPDWWETIKGLGTSSPAGNYTEANADPDGDGYTHLEDYLNWMAAPNFQVNAGSSMDIDLHALARGYLATTPAFTFSSPANGTVTLVSSRYARFTPSTGANALGRFTFTVTDSQGDSMSRTVNVRIVGSGATPPAAPTGLGATAGNAQVALAWTASSGSTSYNVKRSTTSGSGYATVGTATGTSFTNTGLTNGTTYYYVVSAVNSAGESANSAQVSATPQPAAPSAPTGLSASAGNAQVSLSWSASAGAASYNIKRSTTSGSGYVTVGTASGTSFTNTGLTNGTTCYYVVSAVNSAGESANSVQAFATPAIPPASGLLLYEGFNYASGLNLSAQNGGTGWGLPWSNAAINNGITASSGLSYPALSTAGLAGQFGGNAGSTVVFTRRFADPLGASAGGGGGTVWLSMLYLNTGSTTAEARIGFYGGMIADANGHTSTSSSGLPHPVDLGRPPASTGAADQIYLYNGTSLVTSGIATPRASAPAFLLLKFNLSGNSTSADSLQLWVNPNLANGEAGLGSPQATWTTALDLEVINGLRLQQSAAGTVLIDEIRLGSSFASVAPGGGVPSVTLQIESSTYGSGVTIDSNNAGFNGTGFANFPVTGGYAQFSGIGGGSSGGPATLAIRYALGIATSRTGNLLVNGSVRTITFEPTGAWTTWNTLNVPVTLASGSVNTLRFESTGQDLGNIDQIFLAP